MTHMTRFQSVMAQAFRQFDLTWHAPLTLADSIRYVTGPYKTSVPPSLKNKVRKILPDRVTRNGWIIWKNSDGDLVAFVNAITHKKLSRR